LRRAGRRVPASFDLGQPALERAEARVEFLFQLGDLLADCRRGGILLCRGTGWGHDQGAEAESRRTAMQHPHDVPCCKSRARGYNVEKRF
jgi:hypothetical protein